MSEVFKYHLIGANEEVDEKLLRYVILDSNVALDISRTFYRGQRDEMRRRAISDLLKKFPSEEKSRRKFVDINYGWALMETCISRSGVLDLSKYSRIKFALDEVLDWSSSEVDARLRGHQPLSRYSKSFKNNYNRPVDQAYDGPMEEGRVRNTIICGHYGPILKIRQLLGRSDLDGPEKYRNFVDWVTDDLGVRSAYPLQLALSLFVGNNTDARGAKKLIKFGGAEDPDKSAELAWNAAWDALFTGLTEGFTYNLLSEAPPQGATALATANRDPVYLRQNASLKVLIDGGNIKLPMLEYTANMMDKYANSDVLMYRADDPTESLLRAMRDPIEVTEGARRAVFDLESKMHISEHAFI